MLADLLRTNVDEADKRRMETLGEERRPLEVREEWRWFQLLHMPNFMRSPPNSTSKRPSAEENGNNLEGSVDSTSQPIHYPPRTLEGVR